MPARVVALIRNMRIVRPRNHCTIPFALFSADFLRSFHVALRCLGANIKFPVTFEASGEGSSFMSGYSLFAFAPFY